MRCSGRCGIMISRNAGPAFWSVSIQGRCVTSGHPIKPSMCHWLKHHGEAGDPRSDASDRHRTPAVRLSAHRAAPGAQGHADNPKKLIFSTATKGCRSGAGAAASVPVAHARRCPWPCCRTSAGHWTLWRTRSGHQDSAPFPSSGSADTRKQKLRVVIR